MEDSRLASQCAGTGLCVESAIEVDAVTDAIPRKFIARKESPFNSPLDFHHNSECFFLPAVNTNGARVAPVVSKEAAKP